MGAPMTMYSLSSGGGIQLAQLVRRAEEIEGETSNLQPIQISHVMTVINSFPKALNNLVLIES
jgi:hypothetical protein